MERIGTYQKEHRLISVESHAAVALKQRRRSINQSNQSTESIATIINYCKLATHLSCFAFILEPFLAS